MYDCMNDKDAVHTCEKNAVIGLLFKAQCAHYTCDNNNYCLTKPLNKLPKTQNVYTTQTRNAEQHLLELFLYLTVK